MSFRSNKRGKSNREKVRRNPAKIFLAYSGKGEGRHPLKTFVGSEFELQILNVEEKDVEGSNLKDGGGGAYKEKWV